MRGLDMRGSTVQYCLFEWFRQDVKGRELPKLLA